MALLATSVSAVGIAGCEEKVISVVPPFELRITFDDLKPPPGQITLLEGEEEELEALLTGPGGEPLSGRPVTWRSDDPAVSTVTSSGVLRGIAPGVTAIRAEVGDLQASITVIVLQGPTIALSSQLLQLEGASGEEPLELLVLVENSGNGSLSGLVASVATDGPQGEDWLVASLQGGSAPTTLAVEVVLEDLAPGFYTGRVTITDPGAVNSPQVVEVEVDVGDPLPKVELNPTVVFVGAASGTVQSATSDVSVENGGGGLLEGLSAEVTYLSGGAEGWLSTNFAESEAPTVLTLAASARFLPPGTYVAEVEVTATSAPGASDTVRVTFTVQ